MPERILVAGTGNDDKVVEIKRILDETRLEIRLRSIIDYEPAFNPIENGYTLEANVLIKARTAFRACGQWSIADDTGLFIDALGGRPGVFSSRYAGETASYADNRLKVLREMVDVPEMERGAMFRTVVAIVYGENDEELAEGVVKGRITFKEIGEGGFGYDSIFFSTELKQTFAEVSLEKKNSVSHRGRALRAIVKKLRKRLGNDG